MAELPEDVDAALSDALSVAFNAGVKWVNDERPTTPASLRAGRTSVVESGLRTVRNAWPAQSPAASEPAERGDGERLLPCPFCGGPADLCEAVESDAVPRCNTDGCWAILGAYATEAEAIAAWNRRARTAPAQPPANAQPPELPPVGPGRCKSCGAQVTTFLRDGRCEYCCAKAYGSTADQSAELPADWREAVVRAVSTTVRRVVERLAGSERLDPPATPAEIARLAASDSADEVLSALAPLVLGERLRSERLRRAAISAHHLMLEGRDASREEWPDVGLSAPGVWERTIKGLEAALAADPPDAALAELLALPGRLKSHADEWAYVDSGVAAKAIASELSAVLARCGLPAAEEAGDG